MKIQYILPVLALLGFGTVSCDDFLDCPPTDQIDDSDYWKTEEHIRVFANGFYPSYFTGFGGNYGYNEKLSDNWSDVTQTTWPYLVVSGTDAAYTYSRVLRANYYLSGVDRVPGLDDAARNHWVGIGRLYRGIEYANLSFLYGDTQWYTTRINSTQLDSLYKPRDSRDKVVMPRVIADLRFALENIRENDGELHVNKYVAAAMISRAMLREGTFLKYHDVNPELGRKCLELAKEACLVVMNADKYTLAEDYHSLFCSDDLAGNPEVILYKRYIDTKGGHNVYEKDPAFCPKKSADYFADRDPRLSMILRPDKYYIAGEDVSGASYSRSGFSLGKYMDPSKSDNTDITYTANNRNVTDCPQFRLGEILANYAEICYELGTLSQKDLDMSINVLRARKGVNMPALQIVGGEPAVAGIVYDDPCRDADVPSMLWEIRRERRVEMAFEGSRLDDLKRWKKLIYLWSEYNPNIDTGAWISYSPAPQARDYIRPIPTDQIQLFKQNGYVLEQNPEWK